MTFEEFGVSWAFGRWAGAHLDVRRLLLKDQVGHLLGNLARGKKKTKTRKVLIFSHFEGKKKHSVSAVLWEEARRNDQ